MVNTKKYIKKVKKFIQKKRTHQLVKVWRMVEPPERKKVHDRRSVLSRTSRVNSNKI